MAARIIAHENFPVGRHEACVRDRHGIPSQLDFSDEPLPIQCRFHRDGHRARSSCGEAAPALDAQRETETLLMRVTFTLI